MIDRRAMMSATAAVAASAIAARVGATPSSRGTFPKGFLWGASTAGHQIEGNDTNSDMWLVENIKPTIYAEPSGDACNSFELWREDLDLVHQIGLNAYRFSIEWARIEPEPGQFSQAMLDHYRRIIDGCNARGITPVVTFNHYSAPLWFAKQGAWTAPKAPAQFARYCERAAKALASGIGMAATLNEPNMAPLIKDMVPDALWNTVRKVYAAAGAASGAEKFTLSQMMLPEDIPAAAANLLAAHKAGREAIKAVRPELPVGVCLALQDEQGGDDSLRDRKRDAYYGAWLDAVKGDDFVGVQNYLRNIWGPQGKLPSPAGGRRNMDGDEVYPASLANAVRYAHARSGCPVLVSEHGVNTADDSVRAWLIPEALKELQVAMAEGIPVKGYMHWSLLDNFEWMLGYRPRYGLASVDRTSFRRTLKPSASVYGHIARTNRV